MCRVQADGDNIGDDADAPDANGLSDAAGVIAAEEEVVPAEKAPVEAVADEAVVDGPQCTSIDLVAEKGSADETTDADFWSTRVVDDTHQCMEGIMASAWQDHDASSDVDIASVHSDIVEVKDDGGHLSGMIQVFV